MDDDFSPKQYRALCALVAGRTLEEAAREAGCSISAVEKWKKKPDFSRLLRQSVAKVYDTALAELTLGAMSAARALREIVDDDETPSRVKISAIGTLLSHAEKAKQSVLEERLERIEDLIDGTEQESIRET